MVATPMRHWAGPDKLNPRFQALLAGLAGLTEDPGCPYAFQFSTIEGGLIRGRNKLVESFLRTGCTWLLFVDDDIEGTAEDVLRLLSHRRPIVGALYATREERPHWVANFMHEVKLQPGGLLQVVEVGIGWKLYHREVFRIIAEKFPTIAYTDRDTGAKEYAFFQQCVLQTDLKPEGDMLSEDYFLDYLCRISQVKGMGIFVDTTLKLKHRGRDGTLYPKGEWPPIPGLE